MDNNDKDNSLKTLNYKSFWKNQRVTNKRIKYWKNLFSKENDTHEFTPVRKDQKVIGSKWIYARKLRPNNKEQFKANIYRKRDFHSYKI